MRCRNGRTEISYEEIYDRVRQIPYGRVASYGQIARLVGGQCTPRQVGYALAALPDNSDVPWHRVINAEGRISARQAGPDGERLQRILLEDEGVRFSTHGTINLTKFGWQVRAACEIPV